MTIGSVDVRVRYHTDSNMTIWLGQVFSGLLAMVCHDIATQLIEPLNGAGQTVNILINC